MHPRCRSTISAVVEGGTRAAKVGGKNIRVPADMTYGDYKRVYVDKSLTLKDWTSSHSPNIGKGLVAIPDASISKLAKDVTPRGNSIRLNEMLKKFVTEEYFAVDKGLPRPIAYSYIEGKIFFNPEHSGWKMYNVVEAVTHEVIHLIDFEYNISIELTGKIAETAEKTGDMFEMLSGDLAANMSVSDLVAALSGNRFHGKYYHSAKYWSEIGNVEREVVANLMTIYYTADVEGLAFIERFAPLKELFEEVKTHYERYT